MTNINQSLKEENYCISLSNIQDAAKRIKGIAKRTPLLTNKEINNNVSHNIYFKVESFQQTGSFKFRGACNAVQSILESSSQNRHVVTHSSGNHAAALAYAASSCNATATIVMPKGAPVTKKENTMKNGGTIVFVENTNEARQDKAAEIEKETGAEFIHPSEDPRVIAGQGTVTLEMLEQLKEEYNIQQPDIVIMPCGGGGLASGNTMTLRSMLGDNVKIILAEPKEVDDAYRSFSSQILQPHTPNNKLNTIADGLKSTLGPNTFGIIKDLVNEIFLVEEADIIKATKYVWETLKVCIEPSSATVVAVLLSKEFQEKYLITSDKRLNVGIVLSGGNVDIFKITEMMKSI